MSPQRSRSGLLSREISTDDLVVVLLLLTFLAMPLELEYRPVAPAAYDDSLHRVSLFAYDIPALALLLVCAPRLTRAVTRGRLTALAASLLAVVAATVLSAAVHPSARAAQAVLRLGEALAIGHAVYRFISGPRRSIPWVLAVPVVLQAALAVAQVAQQHVVGLTLIGEHPPLLPVGNLVMAKGTFTHPYLLAGWAAVSASAWFAGAVRTRGAASARRAAVVAMLAMVPLALTYSRMTALGLLLAAPPLLWAARRARSYRLPLVAVASGFGVPALLTLSGWLARGAQSTGANGSSLDALTSGRVKFAKQALALVQDAPLVGVGPGRYATALADHLGVSRYIELLPVHNVPLLIAAEAGVIAGAAAVTALVALGAAAARQPCAWAAFGMYLPFVLLDVPYALPMGIPVLGAWVGVVAGLSRQHAEPARTTHRLKQEAAADL